MKNTLRQKGISLGMKYLDRYSTGKSGFHKRKIDQ